MFRENLNKKAFTLIELLVVISIIAVLVSLSLVSFSETRKSARDSKRKADLEQIRSALEIYRNDVREYPSNLPFGAPLTSGSEVYMEMVPKDPLTSQSYCYLRISSNEYCLCAAFETAGTAGDNCTCGSCPCVSSVPNSCNYKIKNP